MTSTKGTCQICRREFKVTKSGKVARHGHNNKLGVGGNHCPGSNARPLEVSVDVLDREIERLQERVDAGNLQGKDAWTLPSALKAMKIAQLQAIMAGAQ